jgi:hypothetical protein
MMSDYSYITNAKITNATIDIDRGFVLSGWPQLDYGGGNMTSVRTQAACMKSVERERLTLIQGGISDETPAMRWMRQNADETNCAYAEMMSERTNVERVRNEK